MTSSRRDFHPQDSAHAGRTNEIAVDEDGDHTNQLYAAPEFRRQFALRYHLALRHITAAFKAHPALQAP